MSEKGSAMSEPVYQSLFIETEFHDGWRTIDKQTFEDRSKLVDRYQTRILYPAAAYEALQKENERLDFKFKQHLCSARSLLQKYCSQNAAQAKRIEELEAATDHLGLTPQQAADGLARYKTQVAEIESLRKQVEELRSHLTAVVEEMNHLMNDSKGVAGLHLNGDIAPWASLLRGGEFDTWLSYLSDAAEYIQSKNGE